jgi:hypothetical protein
MPTYDYVCSECSFTFDKILKIDDRTRPTEEPCPNCQANNCVTITLSAPSLMSPLRVDGLRKPPGQFRERMQQIKKTSGRNSTIKDY